MTAAWMMTNAATTAGKTRSSASQSFHFAVALLIGIVGGVETIFAFRP
jgi:hypothetical protein